MCVRLGFWRLRMWGPLGENKVGKQKTCKTSPCVEHRHRICRGECGKTRPTSPELHSYDGDWEENRSLMFSWITWPASTKYPARLGGNVKLEESYMWKLNTATVWNHQPDQIQYINHLNSTIASPFSPSIPLKPDYYSLNPTITSSFGLNKSSSIITSLFYFSFPPKPVQLSSQSHYNNLFSPSFPLKLVCRVAQSN